MGRTAAMEPRPDGRGKARTLHTRPPTLTTCLLYTSDAADERSSVDLGGRRIIKKKNILDIAYTAIGVEKKRVSIREHEITTGER